MNSTLDPQKTLLLILDGLGLNNDENVSAVTPKSMPVLHNLMQQHGYAELAASEQAVGLDKGQAGNSEVGHMTIGAGRKLIPTLDRIRMAYEDGTWFDSQCWEHMPTDKCRPLHIVGLLSDAGIHGHWQTLVMSADLAIRKGYKKVFIHLLLDGVDSQAGSAARLLNTFLQHMPLEAKVASIMGRKWATDRSGNWVLTEECVNALRNWDDAIEFSMERLEQHLSKNASEATLPRCYFKEGAAINEGEGIILTSHRADRASQLAKCLAKHCPVTAMVELKFESVEMDSVFFPTQPLDGGLIDLLNDNNVKTHRISESCKFPHVTYFINGMKPSLNASTTEIETISDEKLTAQPEMSLFELADNLEQHLAGSSEDLLTIVNIPNLDQVGHQGDLLAATKAAEFVDGFIEKVVSWCAQYNWNILITADHGNADVMQDTKGAPLGSHSKNPVPMLAISNTQPIRWKQKDGCLVNVASSLLHLMGIQELAPSNWADSLIDLVDDSQEEFHSLDEELQTISA